MVLLHLSFRLVIAEVTAGVAAAWIHTLLEWQLQGSAKVTGVPRQDMKTHMRRRANTHCTVLKGDPALCSS